MTLGPFNCCDLIQDELESQYRENSLAENIIFSVLHIHNKICNIYFVFPEKLSYLYTSETIFTFGTICKTHFKLIEMKNLKNVSESTLRGENK